MPTYPPAHKRVQIQGSLAQQSDGGSEIFDFSFCDASALSLNAVCAAVSPLAQDIFSNAASEISSFATLTGVRAEAVAADGTVTDSFYLATPHTVGLSDGAVCTVLCSAVTLETNTPGAHGRHVQGRFYPPAYPGVLGATMSAASVTSYAQAWAAFVTELNGAGLVVSVASTTMGGQIAHVTAVTADNVIDTQRRRRNHVAVVRCPRQTV